MNIDYEINQTIWKNKKYRFYIPIFIVKEKHWTVGHTGLLVYLLKMIGFMSPTGIYLLQYDK